MGARSTVGVPRPSHTLPVPLTDLAGPGRPADQAHPADPASSADPGDVRVTGVTASADWVRPGDLFAGLAGRTVHGARFAGQARERGAVAVLTDAAGARLVPDGMPTLVVADVRAALGEVSSIVYGRPTRSLRLFGVTGTSGKTTTSFLMRAGLLAAGRATALIGTVATMIGDDVVETGFTTPEAPELQALLAVMVERGVTDVAMEVSSHAVAMHRTDGLLFDAGGFTNLSEDHLDFHADMEDYFAAKLRFVQHQSARPVVVVDDEWGRRAARAVPGATTVSTDGADATVRALDVAVAANGTTSFAVEGPWGRQPLGCAIPGRFNVANATLALTMLAALDVDVPTAAGAIGRAQVPGRMERVDAGQDFLAVVDYSHKPAAVEGALRALRPLTPGRLIIALGCGGDRDRGKRPHMGEAAARGADLLIVTDDNPRSEDPAAIRSAMLAGALAVPEGERGEVDEVGDRRAAIEAAVAAARPGDTVLIAGKGHETGQEVAGVVHPFDDRLVLRDALGVHA